jgi:GntR family transcriptional regulator/MocR family aminotransferase
MPMIALNEESATPRYRQIYDAVRAAILAGQLTPGTRLPATRALATALGVARNTVVNAFEQLIAEGYLASQVGAGTTVARTLPDARPHRSLPEQKRAGERRTQKNTEYARENAEWAEASRTIPRRSRAIQRSDLSSSGDAKGHLSRRGAMLATTRVSVAPQPAPVQPFRTGTPDFAAFPGAVWARLASRHWQHPAPEVLTYGDPAGYWPLRVAIAAYLGEARAVRCTPEQVIVVAGSQQGVDLAARLLLDPGDAAWVEDPGYLGARAALMAAGATIVPIPVRPEGLDVAAGLARAPQARLACVAPSHQFPLGVMLSLQARLALLDWAIQASAWVVEDDYDSEYRYGGRPLAAMQGLDNAGRVIYIGTFSKVLFPSLRLGYVVAPPELAPAFAAARALADRHSPTVEQAILADFIAEGHFARHIRRMRTLYGARQAVLIDAVQREIGDGLTLAPANAGMHLVAWLPEGADDQHIARSLAEAGITAHPVSAFIHSVALRPGLLLGYAAFSEDVLREGVARMANVLRTAVMASRNTHRTSGSGWSS